MPAHTLHDTPVELPGIRALSIRQPWASLILRYRKTTENRTWLSTSLDDTTASLDLVKLQLGTLLAANATDEDEDDDQ